jgi:chromosome segregation ATPase
MTFTQTLKQALQSRQLVTIDIGLTVIQGLFEDLCSKMDDMASRISDVSLIVRSKPDKADIDAQFESMTKRVRELEENTKQLGEAQTSLETAVEEKLKTNEAKIEAIAETVMRGTVHDGENEVMKTVLARLSGSPRTPSEVAPFASETDAVMSETGALSGENARILGENARLSGDDARLSGENASLSGDYAPPRPRSRASPPVEIRGLSNIQEDIGLLKDEVEQLKRLFKSLRSADSGPESAGGEVDAGPIWASIQVLEENVERALAIGGNVRNKIDNIWAEITERLRSEEEERNTWRAEHQKHISQVNGKCRDLETTDAQLSEKITAVQRSVEGLRVDLEEMNTSPIEAQQLITASGDIDLSPILLQLKAQEVKARNQNDRLVIIENREMVHPLTVQNIRETVDQLEASLREMSRRLTTCETDVKASTSAVTNSVRLQGDRIVALDEKLTEFSNTTAKRIGRADVNAGLIHKLQDQCADFSHDIEELKGAIGEVGEKVVDQPQKVVRPSKDPKIDSALELARTLEQEMAGQKANLLAMSNAVERLSTKVLENDERDVPDMSSAIDSIRAELRKLWLKMKELAELSHETKDDFIPRVDLSRLERPAARPQPVERSALPRIAPQIIKSPRDDPRLGETASRLEKQGDILSQLKRAIEVQHRSVVQLDETKADRVAVQQLFEQFRLALGELNNRIGSLRRALVTKVDNSELQVLLADVLASAGEDTSTGTVKCLCCGRNRKIVAGTLDDTTIAERIGAPTSTRVLSDGGGQVCFVYGEHGDMYYGRSNTGRSVFSKAPEVTDSGNQPK